MSQVCDSFSDAELTQLASEVINDLRNNIGCKPPIDPSFLLFRVDSDDISDVHYNTPSLYPYSTSTDTSIYTKSYPDESEYKYQILNISTNDSFYNCLPPIPSPKSYTIPTITSNSQFSQSVISKPHTISLIGIGNKKRGVKQWHKRNKNKNNEKRHNSATIYGSSSIQTIDTSSCLSLQKRKKTKTKNSQIPDFMKHTTNKVHNKNKRKHKKKKKMQRPRLQKY